jgi:hypothetical protein
MQFLAGSLEIRKLGIFGARQERQELVMQRRGERAENNRDETHPAKVSGPANHKSTAATTSPNHAGRMPALRRTAQQGLFAVHRTAQPGMAVPLAAKSFISHT